jgi:transcription elongation factor Elf1
MSKFKSVKIEGLGKDKTKIVLDSPSQFGKLGMKEMLEQQNKEEWYCGNCGTAKKGNTVVGPTTKDRILTCGDCGIVIRFYIQSPPIKTIAEAAKAFEATELTKQQKTGSGNKKPFKYKGKNKK